MDDSSLRTVTVTGTGSVGVVPDVAVLRVAAQHRSDTVAGAVAGLVSAVEVVARSARGVTEPRHVATTGLQVWPRTDAEGRPDGAEASQQVTVRCPDVESASQLLASLAGEVGDALRVDGLELMVSDGSEALLAAREAAFVDARARAEHLASLASAELGDVVAVSEGDAARPGFESGARMALAAMPIETGEQQVSCALRVTWQLT